jgi:hypothetical protein
MKKLIVILVMSLCVVFGQSAQSNAEDKWTGNVNLLVGAKALDKNDWEPIESQPEAGVIIDIGKESSSLALTLGFMQSSSEDSKFSYLTYDEYGNAADFKMEGSTTELRLGIKQTWKPATAMRPYLAAGVALIGAEGKVTVRSTDTLESISVKDSGQSVGAWVGGGLYWIISRHLNLGFDLSYSAAKVTLFDTKAEAGGGHAALLVGYHW